MGTLFNKIHRKTSDGRDLPRCGTALAAMQLAAVKWASWVGRSFGLQADQNGRLPFKVCHSGSRNGHLANHTGYQ